MSDIPNDDKPGFVAEKPEHCFACYRLIRPGQIYHLTIEFEVLCEDCALSEGVIRVREDLAVEVKRDRLLIQRGKAEVEVFPGEIRHLVNALARRGRQVSNSAFSRPPKNPQQRDGLDHSLSMNSSGVTPACFRIPRNVPTASWRCKGTTHPTAPSDVSFLSTT